MKLLITLITLLSFFSTERIELNTTPNSSITVKGTSTLHDWSMTSNELQVNAVINASENSFEVEFIKGSLDVRTLKSESSQMDKNAYNTLKADKYPTITFDFVSVISENKEEQLITALFDVTISGTTKQIEVAATAIPEGDKMVVITGVKKIKMTDFSIKPPSFMFGALKTGNDLTIEFNLTLAVADKAAVQDTNL